jgi:hypothetical protein
MLVLDALVVVHGFELRHARRYRLQQYVRPSYLTRVRKVELRLSEYGATQSSRFGPQR